ncbi:hypothetical protein OQA88_458 [Cercophora sp. LCS_1]
MGVTAESTDPLLSGITPDDLTNANTITKWLLTQKQEFRPRIAQGLFEKLLQDASQSRQHQQNGQVCVKLCSFVQQCCKSSDEALKEWAFTEPLSMRLFNFYLEWYEHDPHRALRMVLDILAITTTQNPNPDVGRSIKNQVLETLVLIITRKYPKLLTKSGLQCLDNLITKKAVNLDDISSKYRQLDPSLAGPPNLLLWKSLVSHLFSWMELTYLGPLAGKSIVHLFRGLQSQPPTVGFTIELWLQWLQDSLARNPAILEDVKNYVLVPIFKTDKISALILLQAFNRVDSLVDVHQKSSDQAFMLQLATLELGKRFALVEEPSSDVDAGQSSQNIFLRESVLDRFLSNPSISVRSSAFSLLVSSQATSKPFSKTAIDLLKRHLAPLHTDYDAKFRNELLGLTKSLIRRVKNIITVAQRRISGSISGIGTTEHTDSARPPTKRKFGPEANLRDEDEAKEVIELHEEFMRWYLNFLKQELIPTASYQRHITALRATALAMQIGKFAGAPDEIDLEVAKPVSSDSSWIRHLLDLILDPFDDVRDAATAILGMFPPEIVESPASPGGGLTLRETLVEFCARSLALADRTGRADHGDGAARAQGLLCRWLNDKEQQIELVVTALKDLGKKISEAEKDLGHAAIQSPVHGDFASISYIWQVLQSEAYSEDQLARLHDVYRQAFDYSHRIWVAVKHVLCDDSPEGHLPEEMEEIEGLDTKDLLSYSFRAVHESSNLIRLMMATLRLEPSPGVPFPPLTVFRDVGYLTFEQLAALRHRGAFSTVSLTFTTCCQLTQRLQSVYADISGADNLLREWYQGALLCIETQASTTRRSAGIPSLIGAVLSANAASPSFGEVFAKLEEIGRKPALVSETDGSNLPQVHALNCIRGVFRSSLLSKKAEAYLAVNLQLASNSLKSEVWAIRNCGLLLLRSLIDCLLGTGESKALMESGWDGHSVRISYNKYPTLPGVILSLLKSGEQGVEKASTSAAEAVFPALDIIRRAGPPGEHRDELRSCIEGYLGSRLWHVREMAARTLCSFLLQADWVAEIKRLLDTFKGDANRLHGILLTAKFVVERKLELAKHTDFEPGLIQTLLSTTAQNVEEFSYCPEIEAAYLEILNIISESLAIDLPAWDLDSKPASRFSALLEMQRAVRVAYDLSTGGNIGALRSHLLSVLETDVNTARRLLEVIPNIWGSKQGANDRAGLCKLYGDMCCQALAPEIRAQSLSNLASLIDAVLHDDAEDELPTADALQRVWGSLHNGEINPDLSYSIINSSGTFMLALDLRDTGNVASSGQRLRGWGAMIADALNVDNTFDTRYAAITAFRTFFLGSRGQKWTPDHLPALSALYDGLIDDDDEVREVAAEAASGILGPSSLMPPTAADRLVEWLGGQFQGQQEFRQHVIHRMTGQLPLWGQEEFMLPPADEQLRQSMEFDDALFATEEQNLFIDEISETKRWQKAFARYVGAVGEEASYRELVKWTVSGLKCLMQLAEKEDGPLGWTSDQHAFAESARIVLCSVAIAESGKSEEVSRLVAQLRETGTGAKLHGSLLEMAKEV